MKENNVNFTEKMSKLLLSSFFFLSFCISTYANEIKKQMSAQMKSFTYIYIIIFLFFISFEWNIYVWEEKFNGKFIQLDFFFVVYFFSVNNCNYIYYLIHIILNVLIICRNICSHFVGWLVGWMIWILSNNI